MTFELTEKQIEVLKKWDHDCSILETGTIGGRTSFIFTPTSLGVILIAKCICGESIDLTGMDDW